MTSMGFATVMLEWYETWNYAKHLGIDRLKNNGAFIGSSFDRGFDLRVLPWFSAYSTGRIGWSGDLNAIDPTSH